jgi:hypothetical protein
MNQWKKKKLSLHPLSGTLSSSLALNLVFSLGLLKNAWMLKSIIKSLVWYLSLSLLIWCFSFGLVDASMQKFIIIFCFSLSSFLSLSLALSLFAELYWKILKYDCSLCLKVFRYVVHSSLNSAGKAVFNFCNSFHGVCKSTLRKFIHSCVWRVPYVHECLLEKGEGYYACSSKVRGKLCLLFIGCKIPLVRIGVRTLLLFLPFVIFMCLFRLSW